MEPGGGGRCLACCCASPSGSQTSVICTDVRDGSVFPRPQPRPSLLGSGDAGAGPCRQPRPHSLWLAPPMGPGRWRGGTSCLFPTGLHEVRDVPAASGLPLGTQEPGLEPGSTLEPPSSADCIPSSRRVLHLPCL